MRSLVLKIKNIFYFLSSVAISANSPLYLDKTQLDVVLMIQ